ncbi:response regulator [Undibacterium sp. CY18W]|uniref:Response regulator n=2 Tax=Undibacterium hunanense TaxID=2762292 RepID=A0ABR6ZSW5_9BURK|nr:response regulator [Undibacterium hunanense]
MSNNTTWIAVIDDEESIRRALLRLFRSVGLDAQAFETGKAFLSSLQDRQPCCVVLDLHMPEMSGFAVLDELQAIAPDIPVIILTAHQITAAHVNNSLSSAVAILQKPVNDQALLQTIAGAVRTLHFDQA